VLRHSRAGTCSVVLSTSGELAELRVVNDGVTADRGGDEGDGSGGGGPGGDGWGNGLTGLAERLAATGGRLAAGRDGGRFLLTATVPVGVRV
jgi:two-component system sensor histidine kinase DesK